MKFTYRPFRRHVGKYSRTYPVLSQTGTAHVHSFPGPSSIWWRRYKSRGSFPGYPATKVQKQPNSPIPGLKLATKVNKSRPMPAYVPGVTPPGWPLISALNNVRESANQTSIASNLSLKSLSQFLSRTGTSNVRELWPRSTVETFLFVWDLALPTDFETKARN